MVTSLLLEVMLIFFLGIGSQWVAWRYRMPAIVVMALTGLIVGPLLGFINPQEDFGSLYSPIISVAVAIILFEGSLNLSFKELRGLGKPVFRISTVGAFIAWILGSLTAHYIAGLSWPVAFVIGGLFIVTGPTVIMPLLRQSKLKPRPAKILKWEGIIVDPIGALLAVFAFEIIAYLTANDPDGTKLMMFFAASLFAAIFGWFCGKGIGFIFERGHIPEFLKSPAVFTVVIFCFTVADEIMHETGLLSVTAMGITLANMGISSVADMRHFKENISILLISAIFIMLTASLQVETLLEIFSPNILGYVLLMMFLVRPLSIFLSTFGTGLTLNEKLLVGWIAPRGIVALTVSSYFATILLEAGYEDANILTTLTFGLVFFTVIAHGFSIGWLAKKLNLSMEGRPGTLIVGSNIFTVELAKSLAKSNVPVIIVDGSWERLKVAREAYSKLKALEKNVPTFSLSFQVLAATLVSGCFSLMFGGTWADFLPACLAGSIGYSMMILFDKIIEIRFLAEFIGSSFIGLTAATCFLLGFGGSLEMIIIGAVMPLVPGLPITNAIRDLMAGHLVSGVSKGIESLLTAVAIGAGIAMVYGFFPV